MPPDILTLRQQLAFQFDSPNVIRNTVILTDNPGAGDTTIYSGTAERDKDAAGVLTSEAKWQVNRIINLAAGTSTSRWSNGLQIFDDHLTLTYK